MPDQNQIDIPQSFIALFVTKGHNKPNASLETVLARYELCEDTALILAERAKTLLFDLDLSENEVLKRCHQGLMDDGSVVTSKEADWVITRLAELLEWAPTERVETV